MSAGYLSARHAAEYLDMTFRAFDQWTRREGIPCLRIGRTRRYTRESLDRALKTISLRPRRTLRKVS